MTTLDTSKSSAPPETAGAQANVLAEGLADLKGSIDTLESMIRSVPNLSEKDLAGGYRYLASILAINIERVFKGFDLSHPRLVPLVDDFSRGTWSNPDSHISAAEIVPDGEYRIVGARDGSADFTIETLSGIGAYDKNYKQIDILNTKTVKLDIDNRFEVFVGGAPRQNNWLKTGPDVTNIFVRQTLHNWNFPPAPMFIERLDQGGRQEVDKRPSAQKVAGLLRETGRRMVSRYLATQETFSRFRAAMPINMVPVPKAGQAGLLPTQLSSMMQFQIETDQALIISIEPVDAAYQGIVLGDSNWFETVDPRYAQGSLNASQSHLSSDGLYRYVISATDPGVSNWLDTAGHERGLIMLRWQELKGPSPSPPIAKLVLITDVLSEFPADEPVIGPQERSERIRRRMFSVFRRFP